MIWLIIGSLTMVSLAGLHSYVGETRLLQQLLAKSDLPVLQGSVDYTKAIIRWAWHLTSVAWLGFAAIFIGLTQVSPEERQIIGMILAGVLGLSELSRLWPRMGIFLNRYDLRMDGRVERIL